MRAFLRDISIAYKTGNAVASFEIDTKPENLERLRSKVLDLEVKEHKERRSLNANAYYWGLCQKLASARRLSLTEMHNWIMSDYGQLLDGAELKVRPDIPWMRLQELHLRPTGRMQDGCPVFLVVRPSHTYDTREMSILIDGLIREANEQGIETISRQEKERMMSQYDKAWKRKQVPQQ